MRPQGSASTRQQSEFSGFWLAVFDLAQKIMPFFSGMRREGFRGLGSRPLLLGEILCIHRESNL